MSLSKHLKSGLGQLPKSVKVRSTCNACQQAKIRCSHEKPSCRRCQKHKIECIYSVSRRLGRPAKKKDVRLGAEEQGSNSSPDTFEDLPCERVRAARRTSRRRTTRPGSGTVMRPRAGRIKSTSEDPFYTLTLPENMDDPEISAHLHEVHNEPTCHPAFDMDFNPENWTQQLMSTRLNDDSITLSLDQSYVDIDLEDKFDTPSDYMRHSVPITTYPPGDPYFTSNSLGSEMSLAQPAIDHDLKAFHTPEQMSLLDLKDADLTTWSYNTPRPDMQPIQDIWVLERPHQPIPILLDPSNSSFCQLLSPETSPDSDLYSRDELDLVSPSPNFSCSCYKHAMGELGIRSSLRTGHDGPVSINGILACQKKLLLQTEVILQCNMCSQSEVQANTLMVVIVAIDGLLSTLDAHTTSTGVADDGGSTSISTQSPHMVGKKSRDMEGGDEFTKSQFDAHPLLVGGYAVPLEEKSCFVLQVLQGRLSMLLLTIRRIRAYMQQHSTAVFSKGRLLMIMETDRRLQLIMMKIRMAVS